MRHSSLLVVDSRGNPFARLMYTALLVSIGFMLATAEVGWTQSGSTEGDRLLSAGAKAYKHGEMLDAFRMWEQACAVYARELGAVHPTTLASMTKLANTYNALGQHDKALALNEQTLKLRRVELGEDHPDTLNSMNNLATTYDALGQHNKALECVFHANWTVIPRQAGHAFHMKLDSRSAATRG